MIPMRFGLWTNSSIFKDHDIEDDDDIALILKEVKTSIYIKVQSLIKKLG